MAEPVGIALGVLGLAGLFSATLEAWSFVDSGRAHARNFSLLRTKLDNQRILFVIWAKRMGFGSDEGYDKRLEDPLVAGAIEQTFNHIQLLFSDTDSLLDEYGIRVLEKEDDAATAAAAAFSSASASQAIFKQRYDSFRQTVDHHQRRGGLNSRFKRFVRSLRRQQKQASIWKVTKWSIRDERKFEVLVGHLTGLVSDLDRITQSFFMAAARSTNLALQEVWAIDDVTALREIEDAAGPAEVVLSSAASIRRQSLESSRSLPWIEHPATAPPLSKANNLFASLRVGRPGSAHRLSTDSGRPTSRMTDASFHTAYDDVTEMDGHKGARPYAQGYMPPTELASIAELG